MPVIDLKLTGFSFKREHEEWADPLDVSIPHQHSCVILTGINAGGKSLTLKALEKFTKLLADPSKSNKDEFDIFAKVSGIDEISARYDFQFTDMEDILFDIGINDKDTLINTAGSFDGIENYDLVNHDFTYLMTHTIETRFSKDKGYTRRHGLRLSVEFDFDYDDEGPEPPDEWGVSEECFSNWETIFENLLELPMDRMYSYGQGKNDVMIERKIREKTGIDLGSQNALDSDAYEWWFKEKAIHFVTKKVIMLQVDEAYQVSNMTTEKLRLFNENANAESSGRQWIDSRLKIAYDKCQQDFDGDEFARFLYPKRKYSDSLDNSIWSPLSMNLKSSDKEQKKEYRDWVYDPPVPTTEISIPENETLYYRKLTGNNYANESSFPDNIEGICQRFISYCPNLIVKYDPDMFFWIIVSGFIDFPDDPSPNYYSSGQRRMISIIEAVMKSESGDVILIDEPELSLHIDWQRRFIENVGALGKKLVIATHSPDIIYNHTEKVVEVPPSKKV